MSEKELVKRVVQCLTCPLGTTNILSIPPATATLSSVTPLHLILHQLRLFTNARSSDVCALIALDMLQLVYSSMPYNLKILIFLGYLHVTHHHMCIAYLNLSHIPLYFVELYYLVLQESVASILKLNVLPVVDKLIALDEYFGASPMLANSLSELDKSSIYTIENNYITTNNKNNVVSGFNYGMPSNSVLSNSTRVKKDNSEGEIWKAFSCGLHLWRHNILCSLDKLMQFINSAGEKKQHIEWIDKID